MFSLDSASEVLNVQYKFSNVLGGDRDEESWVGPRGPRGLGRVNISSFEAPSLVYAENKIESKDNYCKETRQREKIHSVFYAEIPKYFLQAF
jgi:hypothetical protein